LKAAWTGFLLSLSLCLDLGLVNVAVLRVSLERGAPAGFLLGLGSSVGDLVYFALSVFGAAALAEWRPVRFGLWIFGTAVLIYLAGRMLHEVIRPMQPDLNQTPAFGQTNAGLFVTGIGLALASPTAILWFGAVGGSVIASFGAQPGVLWQFAAGFVAAGIVWGAAMAWTAARFSERIGKKLVRWLSLASALLFLYFAAVVFRDGAREFL
jgi:L-lysine exporter family protein LysE/ArgO